MADLNLDSIALADGVAETIVSLAIQDIEGVASIGGGAAASILGALGSKPAAQGVSVTANEDNTLSVDVHMTVVYGYALPDIADAVRAKVADAVLTQVGVPVSSVDVYIDGIQFS